MSRWGIEMIIGIQGFHGPAQDAFFRAISLLGEEPIFLLLIPLLFWWVDFNLGARLALLLLLSTSINTDLKDLFQQPRPFHLDPSVQLVAAAGYGLPSGHAQSAVVTLGIIAVWAGKTWFWIVAAGLGTLIGFSRIYLGVHFPSDVLAGYAAGAILLGLFLALQAGVARKLVEWGFAVQALVALGLPLGLFLIHPVEDTASTLGSLSGISVGLAAARRYVVFGPRLPIRAAWLLGLRFATGGAVGLALYLGLKLVFPAEGSDLYLLFRFLRYGLIGVWVSLGAPWLFGLLPQRREVEVPA